MPHDARDADAITAAMTREILEKHTNMELVLRPGAVFQLTALIQLALRHPGVTPDLRVTGERFLAGVREYFGDCPTVLDIVRRGDDPGEDRRDT
ncbi:MAG TPA: hypothetical protein VIX63_03480 [Vicinamibacterales bacterium]